jgi:hypothetical protein
VNNRGPKRAESRKQAVSFRLRRSDIRDIKQLAERLGARESDVMRFAIKIMLEKLAPLQDPRVLGSDLVPVFMEAGAELMRHFELDAARLSAIINDGVEDGRRVEPDDIQLIAMTGTQRSYLHLRVPGLRQPHGHAEPGTARHKVNGDDPNGHGEGDKLEQSLRNYLYEKYLYSDTPGAPNGAGMSSEL